MDEQVELAVERLARPRRRRARRRSSERTSHAVTSGLSTVPGQLAHALLDPLALVREGELRALVGEPPRDRPRDRAPVGDAEHQPSLARRTAHARGESISRDLRLRCAPCAASSSSCSLAALALAPPPPPPRFQPIRRSFGELDRAARPRRDDRRARRPAHGTRPRHRRACAQPPLARRGDRRSSRPDRAAGSTSAAPRRAPTSRRLAARAAKRGRGSSARRSRRRASAARYRVVLNGFAVELPARQLPRLVRPRRSSRRSTRASATRSRLNREPGDHRRRALAAATGARGDGIKIAIVDDGVDQANPFFNPSGFAYPAGFPKGERKWTTPKVIVARAFPGPGSGARGRLAARPAARRSTARTSPASPRATPGRRARAGATTRPSPASRGVAPRAWIGNYRVFNVPTPIGARRQHAGDRRRLRVGGPRRHGRDQLLRRRPADRPGERRARRGGRERRRRRRRPRDLGRERPRRLRSRLRGLSGNGAGRDLGRGVVEHPRLRAGAPASTPARPRGGAADPVPAGARRPDAGRLGVSTTRRSSTSARSSARDGRPVDPQLCGPATQPERRPEPRCPPARSRGAIALVSRGDCTFFSKAERARPAGAIGHRARRQPPRRGRTRSRLLLPLPAGMIADLDGARLRAYLRAHGGRATVRVGRRPPSSTPAAAGS